MIIEGEPLKFKIKFRRSVLILIFVDFCLLFMRIIVHVAHIYNSQSMDRSRWNIE